MNRTTILFYLSLLVSVALHSILIFSPLPKLKKKNITISKPTRVKVIDRRIVGIKNGDEDSTILTENVPKKKSANKPPRQKELSLSSLSLSSQVQKIIKKLKKDPKVRPQAKKRVRTYSKRVNKREALREIGSSFDDYNDLQNKDFAMHFTPPKGVSEDELNEAEKVFYSFHKRVSKQYITSFLREKKNSVLNDPNIRKSLRYEDHFLTARTIFDRKGNIISIRILKSSSNDNIHELFENTLRGMVKIHNIPKLLLGDQEEFIIYFQLKING